LDAAVHREGRRLEIGQEKREAELQGQRWVVELRRVRREGAAIGGKAGEENRLAVFKNALCKKKNSSSYQTYDTCMEY
jgi:hypothetical protein